MATSKNAENLEIIAYLLGVLELSRLHEKRFAQKEARCS